MAGDAGTEVLQKGIKRVIDKEALKGFPKVSGFGEIARVLCFWGTKHEWV
jgi:hypothetical protein